MNDISDKIQLFEHLGILYSKAKSSHSLDQKSLTWNESTFQTVDGENKDSKVDKVSYNKSRFFFSGNSFSTWKIDLLEWVKNSAWKWYFFLWFQIIFGAKKNPPLDTKCVKTSLTFEGSERNRIKSEGNVLRAKKIYLLLLYFLKLSRKKNILRRPIEIYLYVREFSIFWFVKAWRIEKKRLNISSVLAALVSIIQSLKRIHLIWKI